MKKDIEIKFAWEPSHYKFSTDKKDWYFTRNAMTYVVKWLTANPGKWHIVENSIGEFLESPARFVGFNMIFQTRDWFWLTPIIENVQYTSETPVVKIDSSSKKMWQLTQQILVILEKIPDTRNDDVLLTTEIWKEFYGDMIYDLKTDSPFIFLSELWKLPREDHIKRIRAKIQNVDKRFLPTSWEVAKKRQINQWVWELAMQETTSGIVNP